MANSKQAKKRIKQSEESRQHNASRRSEMRTYMKRTVTAIKDKNLELAQQSYALLVTLIDRYAMKGLIHKNKAARHKSRLNAKIKALSVA